jgi:iron complex transport system ATP-binding protein
MTSAKTPDPREGGSAAVRVQDLRCSIDGAEILKGLSLSVGQGGFLSILGPNGAGKSTFLKCLMRLHERAKISGTVEVEGRSLKDYDQRALARLVSYVPQAGGWIPPFPVIDFARLSRYPHASAVSGLTAADERAVERALELTGLAPLAKRPLKTLSGGERQKAYLAAALAQEPKTLLLDEPAASLDPRHASDLAGLLRRLNRENGLTMLMITHDLNHPLRAGGLALVLKAGEKLYFGPVEGLLEGRVLEAAFDHDFVYLERPGGAGPVVVPA